MEPTLKEGSRLLVFSWAPKRRGDILVFRKEGLIMVKRAVTYESNRWQVRADNLKEGDDSLVFGGVPDADVVGRVIAHW